MSEDDIHGSPAARERFAREHPGWGTSHPGPRRPAGGTPSGGHPSAPHHKKPPAKQAAAATTKENHYSKNSCHVKDLLIFCEDHEKGKRLAAPEEDEGKKEKPKAEGKPRPGERAKPGEKPKAEEKVLVLNVIPHGTMTTRTGGGVTRPGQALTDASLDKYHEQAEDKLKQQHKGVQQSQQRASEARAAQDHRLFGQYRADRAEGRARKQEAAYAANEGKFMKTYGDHVHGDAELYLSQGNPHVCDEIIFKADMISRCSKHPTWKVWDCLTNKWIPPQADKTDMECNSPEFRMRALPPVISASYLGSRSILPDNFPGPKAYWLKPIEPRRYKVHFLSCDPEYAHRIIHLNVYPLVESGIQISISRETGKTPPKAGSWSASIHKYQDYFEKTLHCLNSIVPGGKVIVEVLPEGSFKLANQWKEEDGNNEVVWSGTVEVEVVLFKVSGEKNFLNALPNYIAEVIRKLTDVGITLKAALGAKVKGKAEWKQAPESTKVDVSGAVELSGELVGTVSFDAMLRVADEDVLGGHADGMTTFSLKSELGFEPKEGHMSLPLDVTLQWEKPLELHFLFIYVIGKKSRSYSFLEGGIPPFHVCRVDLTGG